MNRVRAKTQRDAARILAHHHFENDEGIIEIREIQSKENAVILLEINTMTPSGGIVPVTFGPDRDIPYRSIIVEITPEEFEQLKKGELSLEDDWKLGKVLERRA